nr:PREDICTED: uncharacterized protein LOC107983614 [Anolis carolinensis]XP_016853333.1 PREDICTED: uncharacterized protein LOC107983614 [Anolis carolinensis]|eukprot:XP_016853332.1 PREDICTED: uncharacterized protein LOC107983614 [Anolis carolinensis]
MAAVVGALSRLFQPTIGILSGEKVCQGINPWYFLIGLRMVTLFFAFGPWESLRSDLICQWPSDVGDAKAFCSALCYNQQFPIPISSVWAFHFIAIIFTVALMKFVYVKGKDASTKDAEAAVGSSAPTTFGGWRYGIYIFCIVLILTMELIFIWIVLGLQFPIMNQTVVMCYPNNAACPPSTQCALNVQSDKQAILWALAFCAAANASVCIGYLATHGAQACGCCGGRGNTGKANARETVRHGCLCKREGCNCSQDGSGGWMGSRNYWGDSGVEMVGCKCQPEGLNCCCHQGNGGGKDVACGCQGSRQCPCYFQGSEVGHSQNLLPCRDDSEGKLLRGDIELGGENKDWRPIDGRMPRREPLRIGVKKSRGNPGREGRVVKYMSKYQTWGKR